MSEQKRSYKKLIASAAVIGGAAAGLYLRRKRVLSLLQSVPKLRTNVKSVWFNKFADDIATAGTSAPIKKASIKRATDLEDYAQKAGGVVFRRVRGRIVPIRFPKTVKPRVPRKPKAPKI